MVTLWTLRLGEINRKTVCQWPWVKAALLWKGAMLRLNAHNLHQWRRVNAVPWNQGIVFEKSGGLVQQRGETSTVQMATSTPIQSEGFSPAHACNNMMAPHGYVLG
jgi:hypothetical protein